MAGLANMIMARGTAVHTARQIPIMISVKVMAAWGKINGARIRAMVNMLEGGGRINTGTDRIRTKASQKPRIRTINMTASKLTRFMDQISFKDIQDICFDIQ